MSLILKSRLVKYSKSRSSAKLRSVLAYWPLPKQAHKEPGGSTVFLICRSKKWKDTESHLKSVPNWARTGYLREYLHFSIRRTLLGYQDFLFGGVRTSKKEATSSRKAETNSFASSLNSSVAYWPCCKECKKELASKPTNALSAIDRLKRMTCSEFSSKCK